MTTFRASSRVAKILRALQAMPPGTRMTSRALCAVTGVPPDDFSACTARAIAAGHLLRHESGRAALTYSLGTPCQFSDRRIAVRRAEDAAPREIVRQEVPEPILVTKLRDLYFIGEAATTGEPLRLLADALQAARQVLDARGRTRFTGAEVEQFVGREIRAISVAILNATKNLTDALETTL